MATVTLTTVPQSVPLVTGNQLMIVEQVGGDTVYWRLSPNVDWQNHDGSMDLGQITQFYSGPVWFAAATRGQIATTYIPSPASSSAVVFASSGTPPNQVAPLQMAVTKEAPVNVMHPDYGALLDNSHDDTAAINAAIAYAKTAGATGSVGEVYIPAGQAKISSRIQMGIVNGLRIFGDGPNASIINQITSNEPIIEQNAGATFSSFNEISRLRLIYSSLQNVGTAPNARAISLVTTNGNGFAWSKYADLSMDGAAYNFWWGPPASSPSQGVAFWNNTIDNVTCAHTSGAVLNNGSGTAIGSPTNHVRRLTHQGQAPGQGTIVACLNLAAGGSWVFDSLDIEDWTDRCLFMNGSGILVINGAHLERIHAVTAFINLIEVNQSTFDIRNVDATVYRDGPSTPFLFNFGAAGGNFSRGYCGSWYLNCYTSGNLGAANFVTAINNGGVGSQVTLGPRRTDDVSGVVVDFQAGSVTPLQGIITDQGQPTTYLSNLALPTASAAYRGRQLFVKGANATTLDRLVICRQDAAGAYAWVDLF